MMDSKKIMFIVGPTGVGKSEAGFLLAQKIGGEIVSCDAMQVYREVSIACDKPSADRRKKVRHHLLDVVSVTEDFNAARFRQMARAAIADILDRGKIPIVAGGSGMYMSILLDGIFESDTKSEKLRQELQEKVDGQGTDVAHAQLAQLDPDAAAKIHPNDVKRTIRALEVVMTTGQPISQLQRQREGLWGQYDITIFALNRPREQLYRRAEARIDRMFEHGLIAEVRAVSRLPLSRTAAAIIGVPEIMGYLKGEYDLERAKYLMKLHTRHYVKRQLTWFRRDKRLKWMEIEEGQTAEHVVEKINL